MRSECAERSVRGVGHKYLGASHHAARPVPVAPLLRQFLACVECLEKIIFTFIVMKFRRPDAVDLDGAPYVIWSRVDYFWTGPVDEVLAPVAHYAAAGRTDHDIFVRSRVRQDAVVSPVEFI